MTFGLSAAAIGAITATVAVGTAVYSADQQRKGLHAQQDAINAVMKKDQQEAAQADASAATAANQVLADTRRRRRASALSTGAPDQTLGATSVLGAGSQPTTVAPKPTTALGKGATV